MHRRAFGGVFSLEEGHGSPPISAFAEPAVVSVVRESGPTVSASTCVPEVSSEEASVVGSDFSREPCAGFSGGEYDDACIRGPARSEGCRC